METPAAKPETIDDYIAASPPEVRDILGAIRLAVAETAPDAREVISYRMPAFKQNGILIYFAAFKHHIGVYPPVSGDPALEKAVAPFAGEKGNLKFPLDRPIPLDLIRRIVRHRLKQEAAKEKQAAKAKPKTKSAKKK